MTQDELKQIADLIKAEVRPVKELVEIIRNKVEKQELYQHLMSSNIKDVKDQQSVMNDKMDSHTGSLVNIEAIMEAYSDMYKVNKSNINRLDHRVSVVESKLQIEPAPEYQIHK